MTIAKEVKKIVMNMEEGKILTYQDFSVLQNSNAVALALSRMVKNGIIERLKKGQFYKPKNTKFGKTGPREDEVIQILLNDGRISGCEAYNRLGITTQVPNEIIIVGKKYNRKSKIGNLKVRYQKREGDFPIEDGLYLQILDALKDIKKIPGTSILDALKRLISIISKMNREDQRKIIKYGLNYKPAVRALLGAILEDIGNSRFKVLKQSLNPLTSYNIGISDKILPNKNRWSIR
ncbi:MAG: hypothetical protein KAG61_01185 [Bacteriovoracaceae bacterium]|nr:hypothetical protein [Bacteriovoracaceae bacterium]